MGYADIFNGPVAVFRSETFILFLLCRWGDVRRWLCVDDDSECRKGDDDDDFGIGDGSRFGVWVLLLSGEEDRGTESFGLLALCDDNPAGGNVCRYAELQWE